MSANGRIYIFVLSFLFGFILNLQAGMYDATPPSGWWTNDAGLVFPIYDLSPGGQSDTGSNPEQTNCPVYITGGVHVEGIKSNVGVTVTGTVIGGQTNSVPVNILPQSVSNLAQAAHNVLRNDAWVGANELANFYTNGLLQAYPTNVRAAWNTHFTNTFTASTNLTAPAADDDFWHIEVRDSSGNDIGSSFLPTESDAGGGGGGAPPVGFTVRSLIANNLDFVKNLIRWACAVWLFFANYRCFEEWFRTALLGPQAVGANTTILGTSFGVVGALTAAGIIISILFTVPALFDSGDLSWIWQSDASSPVNPTGKGIEIGQAFALLGTVVPWDSVVGALFSHGLYRTTISKIMSGVLVAIRACTGI